jgi:hypothetical protein
MSALFDSLQSAARLMVSQDGFDIKTISFDHLARTYGTTPDKAREIIVIAQNGTRKLPEEIAATAPPSTPHEEIDE